MKPQQAAFENVKGYATYATAKARGEEVAARLSSISYRWVVVALPSGRFAPCAVLGPNTPGGPGLFISELNFCCVN